MDDPALPVGELHDALGALARFHWMGRAAAHVGGALAPFLGTDPISVADFGCGRGDLLRSLHRRTRGRIAPVGIDINGESLRLAAERLPSARWIEADLLADEPPPALANLRVDVAVSTLFLHHLTEAQAVRLLARMHSTARRGVVVLDLHRSMLSWLSIVVGARLTSRSHVVHVDGALSVRAGWKADELIRLADAASLPNPQVRQIFPCWLLLTSR